MFSRHRKSPASPNLPIRFFAVSVRMSQYYIARIRYQNPLPPPPFPPKLLNIPTPIEPYTTPEYTATLAQQQPPTIDIDAEGGMPLNLAIIPGLFEGDESGTTTTPPLAHCSCNILTLQDCMQTL